jgi:ATP-dependent Clp protease protease subunit
MPISIKNLTDTKTLDLYIYGEITGEKWFDDDITPNDINYINNIDADLINVYLNSPGGDVFAGITIGNILERHKALVSITVDGIAASIASVLLQKGDERIINNNAMVMVHNPMTIGFGYASDFRKIADDLDKVSETIITTYKNRVNIDDNETFMTAKEALKFGFVDSIIEEKVPVGINDSGEIVFNNLKIDKKYKNIYQNSSKIKTFKPEPIDYSEIEQKIIKNEHIYYENIIKSNEIMTMDASS